MSQPEYGIVVAKDVMVPMRDGVRLATDVYRPAKDGEPIDGPLPSILGRTSYDKSNESMWVQPVAEFFCARGYAVAVQDLRGRYRSEGYGQYFHTANPTEGPDGYDTVEWIAAQPWSNGRVGMTGSSHGAIVQQIAALHRPPHLACIWPDVGPTNIYAHEAREGGAMSLQMFGALFMHAHDAQELNATPGGQQVIVEAMENLRGWLQRTPFKPGQTPLRLVPGLERTLFDYYWRGTYDDFWSSEWCNQEAHWERHADIPGVYSGGWMDPFVGGTTQYYAAMAGRNTTPQKLIVGPWTHDGLRSGMSHQGEVELGEGAGWGNDRYNEVRLRFFDRFLKCAENGWEEEPPVRLFVMGGGDGHRTEAGHLYHGGAWRDEREWPPARREEVVHHLRSGGGLTREAPANDEPAARFEFDPDHPVPTIGGSIVSFYEMAPMPGGLDPKLASSIPGRARMRNVVPAGAFDQRERPGFVAVGPFPLSLASRSDVLVFQTEPLDEPIEVTGSITVKLWVSSSAPDTDFTAKLVDVYPPNTDYPSGFDLGLADSIIRARYREGWDCEVAMEPGHVYSVEIALAPISNLFGRGHRIRIDISSSNFPRFDVNPNTGEPVGRHTHQVKAVNTVYLDRERPSQAVLPIIGPAAPEGAR